MFTWFTTRKRKRRTATAPAGTSDTRAAACTFAHPFEPSDIEPPKGVGLGIATPHRVSAY